MSENKDSVGYDALAAASPVASGAAYLPRLHGGSARREQPDGQRDGAQARHVTGSALAACSTGERASRLRWP